MAIDEELDRMRAARIKRSPKVKQPIRKKSLKKTRYAAAQNRAHSLSDEILLQRWHEARRLEMTGICQCGCGGPSQRNDPHHYRASAAHIFPKHLFASIKFHPQNWVERTLWAGTNGTDACHSMMDDASMDRWPNFADWENIKAKFYTLALLLTVEEKATKFYTQLEKLVTEN